MNLKSLKTTPFLLVCILFASACNNFQEKESLNPKLDKLKLQLGFKAEHLFSPSENGMGSWVSMAFDNKDRLITSDQYASTILHLKNGQTVVRRIIDEDGQNYKIFQNPFAPDVDREISKDQVTEQELSTISAMPHCLINRLNEEELKDLLAYLISGGNSKHAIYE